MKLYQKLNHKTNTIEECPYPCQFINSILTTRKKRYGIEYTQINFGKYIKVTKTFYSYTKLELIAEVGGYVGLFLGISVVHISQVVDKILDALIV